MENTKNLIASIELTELFGLTNPNIVAHVTNNFGNEVIEAEVLIAPQGILSYLYDDCKLIFTFRKNYNVFTNKEIQYTGRVSLQTTRDIGAPNLKIKIISLTYPTKSEPLLLIVNFDNIINLVSIKK